MNSFEEYFVWDKTNILITVIVAILILGCLVYSFVMNGSFNIKVGLLTVVLLLVAISFRFNPYKLVVDSDGVKVRHYIGTTVVPAEKIVNIRRVSKEEMRGTIRLFASGGFLGYFGKFRNEAFNNFYLYGTSMSDLVLVETMKGKYVLSSPMLYKRLN